MYMCLSIADNCAKTSIVTTTHATVTTVATTTTTVTSWQLNTNCVGDDGGDADGDNVFNWCNICVNICSASGQDRRSEFFDRPFAVSRLFESTGGISLEVSVEKIDRSEIVVK